MGSNGIGHRTCQHLYSLVGWQPEPSGAAHRLTGEAKHGPPREFRPVLAARLAAGESLQAVALEFGVSHETSDGREVRGRDGDKIAEG